MDLSASLAADLALLSATDYGASATPAVDIAHAIRVFAADVRFAVSSFVGMTITVTEIREASSDEVLLRATLLDEECDPSAVVTSLQLPLPLDNQGSDPMSIRIVFYASRPGAFVDLSADLSFLTGTAFSSADLDQHRGLLNQPDITGVIQAQATISEAIGALLADGHTREQAYAELDLMSHVAGTDRVTAATAVLANLTCGTSGTTS